MILRFSHFCLTRCQVKRVLFVLASLGVSFLWDARFSPANFADYIPAYGAIVIQAVASAALEHTEGVLAPSLGNSVSGAISVLGACVFSLPLYMLRHLLVRTIVCGLSHDAHLV